MRKKIQINLDYLRYLIGAPQIDINVGTYVFPIVCWLYIEWMPFPYNAMHYVFVSRKFTCHYAFMHGWNSQKYFCSEEKPVYYLSQQIMVVFMCVGEMTHAR